MNPIEPHLLTLCAENGAAAARPLCGGCLLTVHNYCEIFDREAPAREAFARAAVETYLAAQPADHAAEARIGVLTSLAANRLAACEQWQQDYYNLQVAHDALKAGRDAQQTHIEHSAHRIDSLRDTASRLRAEIDAVARDKVALENRIAFLQDTVDAKQAEIDTLEAREKEWDPLKEFMVEREGQLLSTTHWADRAVSMICRQKGDKVALENLIATYRAQLAEYATALASDGISEWEPLVEVLRAYTMKEARETWADAAIGLVRRQQEQIDKLKGHLSEQGESLSTAIGDANAAFDEIAALKARLALLPDPFAQWLATATPAERDAVTRAGWEGGAR